MGIYNKGINGPFGQDMEYNLKEPGVYRIVVSENQMVGNPLMDDSLLQLKIAGDNQCLCCVRSVNFPTTCRSSPDISYLPLL